MSQFTKAQQAWLDALESGKYKQTTGALGRSYHKSESYCCLGVACEVAIAHGVPVEKQPVVAQPTGLFPGSPIAYDWIEGVLPTSVQKWLGLKDPGGRFGPGSSLADLNDQGTDFEGIAQAIRDNAQKLFEKDKGTH